MAQGRDGRRRTGAARKSCAFLVAAFVLFSPGHARAMPNLGSRENLPCAGCHTKVPPRLNRFGYDYRRAGFRAPEKLGKDEKAFEFADFFSARLEASVDYAYTKAPGLTRGDFQVQFRELALHPMTGAWGRFFSSMTTLAITPGDLVAIRDGYLRANYGAADHYVHVRVGVFRPFEGYGGSDRPNSSARPLLQTTPASFNQDTFFTPWGFDQAGLELGYTYRGLSVTGTAFSGLLARSEGGIVRAFASQGGALVKPPGSPLRSAKDIQVFVNQMLGDRVALSGYYYHGWLDLPKDPAGPISPDNTWRNSFDRAALYAYGLVWEHLAIQAGAQIGSDRYFDGATGSTDNRFASGGVFGEALVPFWDGMGSIRYDYFDPAGKKGHNEIHAVTAALLWAPPGAPGMIPEYRFVETGLGAGNGQLREHTFELLLVSVM